MPRFYAVDPDSPLVAHLKATSPCKELPWGAGAQLAKRFKVSRQRAHQIIHGAGWTIAKRPRAHPRVCTVCQHDAPVRSSQYCLTCGHPQVACAECGALKRVPRAVLLRQVAGRGTNKAVYTGRFFCDRQCFGRWAGKRNARDWVDAEALSG